MRSSLLLLVLAILALAPAAAAQSYGPSPPRYGAGFDLWSAVTSQNLIPEGPAVGFRLRGALPVNADVSVAADLGVGAHLVNGRSDARYVLNPQTAVIVTLPGRGTVKYLIGGFGGFLPLDGTGGGPTLHAGIGWAVPLRETSAFVELNPSLLIGERESTVVLAARAGVIF